MDTLRIIINQNKALTAIAFFFMIYGLIYIWKPAFLFVKPSDVPREFGVGYKNKTIMPLWLFSILLGILSYFLVVYYVHMPSIVF